MSSDRIVLINGPEAGKTFTIDGKFSIGRNPDSDLLLDDMQVSRRHAVIEQTPNGTLLRDLGSGNGTFVGKQRIKEYRLSDQDIVHIGGQELRFESDQHAPVQPKTSRDSSVHFEAGEGEDVEAADTSTLFQTFFSAPATASDEELRKTQQRLQAVYEANQVIAEERDLNKLFERVMEQIFKLVTAHNGVILLVDAHTGELTTEYVKSNSERPEINISSSIVRRAFDDGEAVITKNAGGDARFQAGMSIIDQNIGSAMCVPLTHHASRLGVLYVDTRGATNAFGTSDLELLVAIAGPAATAIRNAQYMRQLERAYEDTLLVLANAIELRDHYTVGHTWRVTNFSVEIARELDLPEEKIKEVEMGGVLHDVGKIAVDDSVLRKPGRLTDEEYAQMKIHPERGADLLRDVEFLHPLIPYCLYHHERIDGKGYPYGLEGENIPIEGRILGVADAFDAMTSNRPYREGMPAEKALSILKENRGTQFDSVCLDAFLRAWDKGRIQSVLQAYHEQDEKSIACPFCSTYIHIPDGIAPGDQFECKVCHRAVRLQEQNKAFFGELVPQSEAQRSGDTTAASGRD